MKRIYQLKRTDFTLKSTIGELTLDEQHICYILEDRVREVGQPKIYGETAIGFGTYQIIITRSERFSKAAGKDVFLPLLLNVPLYEGIRIHVGNFAADTEGCLIVGTGKTKDMVTNSKKAFKLLSEQIKSFLDAGDEVFIKIIK